MTGSEPEDFAHNNDPQSAHARTERIAQLNDQLRCHARDGRLVVTAGIVALGAYAVQTVLTAISNFDQFSTDNDPHGERDFGALTVLGQRVFWKIDYYDQHMQGGSPDPSDPSLTTRLLTIMLAEEY